jgi:hypothetical protein
MRVVEFIWHKMRMHQLASKVHKLYKYFYSLTNFLKNFNFKITAKLLQMPQRQLKFMKTQVARVEIKEEEIF